MWHDVGQVLKLWMMLIKEHILGEIRSSCFVLETVGEKGRKERTPSFSLRSTEFCQSDFVGPRLKVHCLDKGYAWVPKKRDFTEDPKEEISGNQIFLD